MGETNKKIMTVSFVVAGMLAAYVINVGMELLSTSFGWAARAMSADIVNHGIPVAVGLITFLVLQFNKKIVEVADEVVVEVRKVVWPSRKDTFAMTVVVCVMLIISGLLLGFFDMASSLVVRWIVAL